MGLRITLLLLMVPVLPATCVTDEGECESEYAALMQKAARTRVGVHEATTDPGVPSSDSTATIATDELASEPEVPSTTARSPADDSRFLMQATFGPTRETLDGLAASTYVDWIRNQMALPPGSHRAYYRERANPKATGPTQADPRAKCSKGSRWLGLALSHGDKDLPISVHGNRVDVDGVFRTDVDPEYVGSGLSAPTEGATSWLDFEFDGFICSVDKGVGFTVALGLSRGLCRRNHRIVNMENPGYWLSDPSADIDATQALVFDQLRPEVILLSADLDASCGLGDFVRSGERYFRYDSRVELLANTAQNPTLDACLDVPRTFLNEEGCRVSPTCPQLACGSPGEVANEPHDGHQLHFFAKFPDDDSDTDYDNPYTPPVALRTVARSTVWTMKALRGQDQLRQRVAWSLSQIFVAAVPGLGYDQFHEMWVNYYDIFVRHAFGNIRDILREVTYSPVMGEYLTHLSSTAWDHNNRFPDENYAREIMQLFTIGTVLLDDGGAPLLDDQGREIPTYSNSNVMDLARVFTGFDRQPYRRNIERVRTRGLNQIDPMRMIPDRHDVYPKPDLGRGYLGDGYPLCSDRPSGGFLARGARYEFLGTAHAGQDVFVADPASELFAALSPQLCQDPLPCTFSSTVVLDEAKECYGAECSLEAPSVVQAGDGFYEYVPSTCVHLFFSPGREIALTFNRGAYRNRRECANPAQVAAVACCGSGSEFVSENCGTLTTAQSACASMGRSICPEFVEVGNPCPTGPRGRFQYVWTADECALDVEVDAFGRVSSQATADAARNDFAVQWLGGRSPDPDRCPSGCSTGPGTCICSIRIEASPVFDRLPSVDEFEEHLAAGAFAPLSPCTLCDGDVRVYQRGEGFDINTVFEKDGRFMRNVEFTVRVGDGDAYAFRNPPVFSLAGIPNVRAALAEVEALLDHLVSHPNVPAFIGLRLIQRLVTSNPSREYVSAVAGAFRTGRYGEETFSGEPGDFAAAVAAVLLHPEARGHSPVSVGGGALREPLVKVMHLMRAMEYSDGQNRQVALRPLQDEIGQFPYQSPSVFNFYLPDYVPSGFPTGLVAPEFQILQSPLLVGWLNGMLALIDEGVSECEGGFGFGRPWGCRALPDRPPTDAEARGDHGSLGFALPASATAEEALAEMDLLLTGGRLSASMPVVQQAYESAAENDRVKAALRTIVMSPEFNTLGDTPAVGLRPPTERPEVPEARSYKAVVMLWLVGGVDSFNLLVPCPGQQTGLFQEYLSRRSDVALSEAELLTIATDGQACSTFGVHDHLPILKRLYDEGNAAFVSNIGSLVEPLTGSQFRSGSHSCPGLFSHSDQQNAAQTLKCQIAGASPKGSGGRMADALVRGEQGFRAESFAINPQNLWSQGFVVRSNAIDRRHGVVRFENYDELRETIADISSRQHGNIYCEEYAQTLVEATESIETLGTIFDSATLQRDFEHSSDLADQLRQVARLVAARGDRKAERDFFQVSIHGFDTHSEVHDTLNEKFTEINDALESFVAEMQAQGAFDDVVIVAQSDFGRALPSNGFGTDHGWAGNTFLLGGSVNGGRVYNDFPESLLEGSEQDAGHGRLVPKYPWESMMVPVAQWMGVEESEMPSVFPNLQNFDDSHIIAHDILFEQ